MSYEKQTWATGDTISGAKLNHIEEGVEGINMSYEKTTWKTGDTITAEKLNNIEDGIAGAGGGDFTTAQVIMTNESSTPFAAYCANLFDGRMYTMIDSEDMDGETPFDVVLYKGECQFALPLETPIRILSVTGDIEKTELGTIISGNGTITIADLPA